jgi:hypothetical protein
LWVGGGEARGERIGGGEVGGKRREDEGGWGE